MFALGLCTLVVILATSLILGLYHDMRRFERMNNTVSYLADAQSATAWATSVLTDEKITQKTLETWEDELNGMDVRASLIDIDGLFNMNALLVEDTQGEHSASAVFERLLKDINVNENLTTVIESRAMPLLLVSDVKPLVEMPEDMYQVLLPYVRANDKAERAMHVNTMPASVLSALLLVDEGTAQAVLDQGPFASEAEFNQALAQLSVDIPTAGLGEWLKYDSKQYLVRVEIQPKGAKGVTEMYTLLTHSKEEWRVVYHSIGVRL